MAKKHLNDEIEDLKFRVERVEKALADLGGKFNFTKATNFTNTKDLEDSELDTLLYDSAKLMTSKKASSSLLQRKLSIGYARAARLLDQMKQLGLVGPAEGSKPREVYLDKIAEFLEKNKST